MLGSGYRRLPWRSTQLEPRRSGEAVPDMLLLLIALSAQSCTCLSMEGIDLFPAGSAKRRAALSAEPSCTK